MSDCRTCDTRITSREITPGRKGWLHLHPDHDDNDHPAEPPLNHNWWEKIRNEQARRFATGGNDTRDEPEDPGADPQADTEGGRLPGLAH